MEKNKRTIKIDTYATTLAITTGLRLALETSKNEKQLRKFISYIISTVEKDFKIKQIKSKNIMHEKPIYTNYCGGTLDTDSITEAERMIDHRKQNYQEALQKWWNDLTPKQKLAEWKKDKSHLSCYNIKP
jgi:hypothetical protein